MSPERPPYLDEPRWPTEGLSPPDPVARAPGSQRNRRKLVIGGVAAACALGLGLGLLARPSFRDTPNRQDRGSPAAAADGKIQIVRRTGPVAGASQSAAPAQGVALDDFRPVDTVASAPVVQAAAPAPMPEAPRATRRSRPEPAFVPEDAAAVPIRMRTRPESAVRRPPDAEGLAPRRAARPSFNCRYARSQSEQLVCADGRLAAYDRRLNRAFTQAVRNGVSYRELRREQDRWLQARENAARLDPDAVGDVYRSRIAELEEMADGG